MGDWHQGWGFWWQSPSDSINDPNVQKTQSSPYAGGNAQLAAAQGTAQVAPQSSQQWQKTWGGNQEWWSPSGSINDPNIQTRSTQGTTVAQAVQTASGTPWHEASGPLAGVHAGQFWKSPTNSINDPNVQWSGMDPSGGTPWVDSGLGFRYKSPSGSVNDPNVVIDPTVPAAKKTLSPAEAKGIVDYVGSQAPHVTDNTTPAPAPVSAPAPAGNAAPVQGAGGSGGNYDPAWEPYFQQLAAGLGGTDTNGIVNFLQKWVTHESPNAAGTYNAFGLTEPAPGSYLSEGVSTYPDLKTGVDVMLRALTTHGPNDFGRIGDALRMGDYCGAARLIHQSGWSEGDYTGALLSDLGCTG